MNDDLVDQAEEGKVELVNPIESGSMPDAANFSMAAQRDKFLGGNIKEPERAEDVISRDIREANLRLQREVFPKNKGLQEAYQRYTNPYSKGLTPEEMRESLDDYVSLARNDEAYQGVMADLKSKLPKEIPVYRGQIGNEDTRDLENYSVLPEHAEVFAMGEEGYKEGATMTRELINLGQIAALGSRRESEVIVEKPKPSSDTQAA